ncbi:MAG: ribosome maturation factor RimP [Actinomycetota bacterium]|nr:ribosome maturation factor RimP [Actinomycetota bacterium]
MSLTQAITDLISPAVSEAGFFLEEVQIASPGSHRIITCVVDGQTPLNLDQVTVASRLISELLDTAEFMGETAFTLEVTSPGIDRPLTHPRHWRKNLTRLIKVTLLDGSTTIGRLTEFNESNAILVENIKGRIKEHSIAFADIKRAVVEIEFNRKESSDE